MDESEGKKSVESHVYSTLEKIRTKGGQIKKGVNETTKALERSQAKLVVYASDTSPKEIIMHLPLLCKDKNIPCIAVKSKVELGKAVGVDVPTAAIAVVSAGEESHALEDLVSKNKNL